MKRPLHYCYNYFSCFFLLVSFIVVQAQEDNYHQQAKKSNYAKIELLTIGGSIDLSKSEPTSDFRLLSDRQDFALASGIRITHLFSDKFGWYAGVNIDYLKSQKSPYYQGSYKNIIEEIITLIFFDKLFIGTALEAGGVYRIEKGRWDINPRLGFGHGYFIADLDSDKSRTLEDGRVFRGVYKQRSASTLMNVGVTANYFFTKKSFIVFNLGLQQPLGKSYAEYTTYMDDELIGSQRRTASIIGRNLNFNVGYGFTIGKRKVARN